MKIWLQGVAVALTFLFIITAKPHTSHAVMETYDPTYLMSDAEFNDASAMSCEQIQAFLDKQPGILKNLFEGDSSAAQHICRQATIYGINPRLLIVMIQKEMRMVTSPNPDDQQIGWAAGCGPGWESTRGFGTQIQCLAKTLRRNFDRPYVSGDIDGIIPANQATAALYRYTTHVSGNHLFWQIWSNWFPTGEPSASAVAQSYAPHVSTTGVIVINVDKTEKTPALVDGKSACRLGWASMRSLTNVKHLVTPNVQKREDSTNFVIWRPKLQTAGRFHVFALIPSHNGNPSWSCSPVTAVSDTGNAIYLIQHHDGISRVVVNQAPLNDQWADLGVYAFEAGPTNFVLLTDLTGEPSSSRWVSFSDMKFVPAE
ncbi:MAG: hypothetical protein NTZ50_11720 [Chloroflexi bacterium]|nr:hypothetical protein [Chloroflexota bacterium]